jgi:lipopolysaccharide transport protein LptA
LRIISVGVLGIVLLSVAISFLTRSRRQIQVPEITGELKEQKIDKKERVEYREMKKDQESSEVLADRHYIGEDGLYHLEGHVQISFFNRSEGEDIILRGEEILHDSAWSYFWLRGEATVEFKDLVVESSVLEYDAKKSLFRSDRTVRFSSDAISGYANKCDYFLGEKKAELREKVHLEIQPGQRTSVPLAIDTEYFEYYVGKGRGKAEDENGIELAHGKSRATASLLEFQLSADREQIKSLFLKGGVKISLEDEFSKIEPSSGQSAFALYGDACRIEADALLLKGYVDLPQVRNCEATGKCLFRFVSQTGSYTQIEGEEITFGLTKEGRLRRLAATGNARIAEKNSQQGDSRYIDGHRVQIGGEKNVLVVEGEQEIKARIRSENSEITAQKIWFFLDNNDMEAKEDTKVIIYPKEESQKPIGFLSEGNPVYITAKDMRYSEERKRFRFMGGTKLWQMKETVKAQEMTIGVEGGAVRAWDGVSSVLPYQPKGEEEQENVRIESAAMEYDPERHAIVYSENVTLSTKDVVLTAKLLTILLDEESGDMANIVARNNVVVKQKTYEGHGEEAHFDVREEIITVTGKPVFFDKDKGKIEGGKLTFYMADGRIVVENRDRERSVTVIRS